MIPPAPIFFAHRAPIGFFSNIFIISKYFSGVVYSSNLKSLLTRQAKIPFHDLLSFAKTIQHNQYTVLLDSIDDYRMELINNGAENTSFFALKQAFKENPPVLVKDVWRICLALFKVGFDIRHGTS